MLLMVNNCYSKVSNCLEYRITWTQGSIILLKIDKIWTQERKTLKNTLLSLYKRNDFFKNKYGVFLWFGMVMQKSTKELNFASFC